MQYQNTVKYTTVIPADDIEALRRMTQEKRITSVNQGIRQAIKKYIDEDRKYQFAQEMQEAAHDANFWARTLETQDAFLKIDSEEMSEW